jgi:hypothetical protein
MIERIERSRMKMKTHAIKEQKMENKIDQKVNEFGDKINKCHVHFSCSLLLLDIFVSHDLICMLRKQHHHQGRASESDRKL